MMLDGHISNTSDLGVIGITKSSYHSPARITCIKKGCPAEAAGLLVGDIIISVDGTTELDYLDGPADEDTYVTIIRKGVTMEVKVRRRQLKDCPGLIRWQYSWPNKPKKPVDKHP